MTIEVKVITTAYSCKELPFIDMVDSLCDIVGHQKDLTFIHASIHEDNAKMLILA